MNISSYLSTALLNHSLGIAPYTSPTLVYAGLFNVSPTSATDPGTEVTAPGYARVVITWAPATVGVVQNSASIRFPASGTASSAWGTIPAIGVFDSPTLGVGNLLWFGPLSATAIVPFGSFFSLSPDNLTITLS